MIEIDNVAYSFKKKQVLKEISFEIPKKSIFGLLGQNGAGKSTLIRIILGILVPDSGTIRIDGGSFNEFNRIEKLRKMGSLIEHASLYDFLTPLENLELARRIYGTARGYSEELLSFVGLNQTANQKVGTLSLGMRQRLGIALAMIGNPELVILDEPTNGLDPDGLIDIRNLILNLNQERGTTFLISSHQLSELEKIATHVGIIHNGLSVHQAKIDHVPAGYLSNMYFELTRQ